MFINLLFVSALGSQWGKKHGIKPLKFSKAFIWIVVFFTIVGLILWFPLNVDKMVRVWTVVGFSFVTSILLFIYALKMMRKKADITK